MRWAPRALVAAVSASACGSSSGGLEVVLDGSARRPTDEGVVTAVSREKVTLDGRRTYKVSPTLKSFSTYTLATTPLLDKDGQYVHVGARGGTVYWIAGIADVLDGSVYYTGRLVQVEGDRAVMRDGTVLRLAPAAKGTEAVRPEGEVVARIDAGRHQVVELRRP